MNNRYGLDTTYFHNLFDRELNGSLANHTPSELARVLARASKTADHKVMLEPEFNGELEATITQQAKEIVELNAREEAATCIRCGSFLFETKSAKHQAEQAVIEAAKTECGYRECSPELEAAVVYLEELKQCLT